MNEIKKDIDSVTAVLVLANGAFPHVTVGTDYTLSTLSTLFPKVLASNIAFMFTNVVEPLHRHFSRDTIPDVLQNTPQFIFNNPVALQKKYLKLKSGPGKGRERPDLHKAVKVAEQTAFEMLVDLFDWLDSLEAQSMMDSGSLYEKAQTIDATITNILAQMGQVSTKKLKIDEQTREYQRFSAVSHLLCLHLTLESYAYLDEGHGNFLRAAARAQPQISM